MVAQVAQGLHPAGQAQHHDADVVHHRQQHLAQDLGLRLHLGHAFAAACAGRRAGQRTQAAQALESIHQPRHRVAKADFQPFGRRLDMVAGGKQQGGTTHTRHPDRARWRSAPTQGMLNDRLSRTEDMFAVRLACQHKRLLDARRVGRRKTDMQPGQDVKFVARRREGMNHGNHGRIIPCIIRAPMKSNPSNRPPTAP
jgi:hypothetical protein